MCNLGHTAPIRAHVRPGTARQAFEGCCCGEHFELATLEADDLEHGCAIGSGLRGAEDRRDADKVDAKSRRTDENAIEQDSDGIRVHLNPLE